MTAPKWIDSRYEIIASLGSGGSSRVYKAIDRKDKNENIVAIKLLGRLPDRDQEIHQELFAREVRALSSLSHPRIIRLLEYGHDEGSQALYLVLEYVDNAQTLREFLPTWSPSMLVTIDFAIELLEGLAYAHESYVIHRDFNPANILMDRNGNSKIIDFGISKVLSTLSAGMTVGDFFTRAYASPEQIAGKDADYTSDIFSVAATIYFMLAKKDPETGVLLHEQLAALHEIPDEIRSVLQRMADPDPSRRYSSAQQTILALRTAKRGLESRTTKYAVLLTNNVVKQLYEQAVIHSQNPAEAKRVVHAAFSGTVHVSTESVAPESLYDLLGDGMSLRCAVDQRVVNKEYTSLTVISVSTSIPPHALERMKQYGYPIDAQWHIGTTSEPIPSDATGLSGLLDDIDDFIRRKGIERKQKERRVDLVETWRNILSLDRELKEKDWLRLDYISWRPTDNNAVIEVQLARDVDLADKLAPGQLLVMPSRRSQTMRVGHYIRQDKNKVLISRLRECRLDWISEAGKLSVDERQWASAWLRQRQALDAIIMGRCVNAALPDVLLDPSQAKLVTIEPISRFFNDDLDDEKKAITAAALGSRDLYLIQGPPGTGKTVVISEIIAQILARDPRARILLVSQSNVAIDNVLARVGSLLPTALMVRVGKEERVAQEAEAYFVDRKLKEWADSVRANSETYLLHRRQYSDERKDLEYHLDILQFVLSKLTAYTNEDGVEKDPDVADGIEILQERFPGIQIEPTVHSLEELSGVIQTQIFAQKNDLERTLEDWMKRVGTLDDFEVAYMQTCSIVTGTCVGIVGKRSLPERFDWVIVDEAGRATPSELLIPLVRGRYGILVGDHKQLPPVIEHPVAAEARKRSDIDPVWLSKSLFEYFFERLPKDLRAVLRLQYRMHPHIANLISNVFYPEESLKSGVSAEKRLHGWKKWNTAVVWYSTSQLELRGEAEDKGIEGSKYNLCEVKVIVSQLADLEKDLSARKTSKSVAVIAGYRAQVEQLERQIEPQDKKKWKCLNIEINTVDAFQGREEDIVFYSIVRSNKRREIGFLSDCRRLNVALSRARELLFIVGDHRMVAYAETRESVNPFKDVITHIIGHPAECALVEPDDDTQRP